MVAWTALGLLVTLVIAVVWASPRIWPPRTAWVCRVQGQFEFESSRLVARFEPEEDPDPNGEPGDDWMTMDHTDGHLHLRRSTNSGSWRDAWADWLIARLDVYHCFRYEMARENRSDDDPATPRPGITDWSIAVRVPHPRPPQFQPAEDESDE